MTLSENTITQIKKLRPGKQYAIVFERQLSYEELKNLQETIDNQKLHVKGMLLTGATVLDLSQAIIVAKQKEATE